MSTQFLYPRPAPRGALCAQCKSSLDGVASAQCHDCKKYFCNAHLAKKSISNGKSHAAVLLCRKCQLWDSLLSLLLIPIGVLILILVFAAPAMLTGLHESILDTNLVPSFVLTMATPYYGAVLALVIFAVGTTYRLYLWTRGKADQYDAQLLAYGIIMGIILLFLAIQLFMRRSG